MSIKQSINGNETLLAFIRVFQVLGLPLLSAVSFVGWFTLQSINTKLDSAHDDNVKQDERITNLAERMGNAEGGMRDLNIYIRDKIVPLLPIIR